VAELSIRAPAKLNLVLRVGPLASNGYHPLRSLMVALTAPQDRVQVRRAEQRGVDCAIASGPKNLAWAALDALERRVGRPLPVSVKITKGIPSQAGLGGGSSDAAAVLRATNALYDCGLEAEALQQIAAEVGSDVPFFIRGGTQWAHGRGERLLPAAALPGMHVVIVDAGITLPTATVYASYDRLPHQPPTDMRDLTPANDLWQAALCLAPRLGRVARDLRAAGADRTLLCGSGGAVAGLFPSSETAAIASSRLSRPYRTWVARPDTTQARPAAAG